MIGAISIRQAWGSLHWPTTTGEVIESRIHAWNDGDVPGARYQARIVYQYSVDGMEYHNNRISYRGSYSTVSTRPDPAGKILNRYPLGKSVTIYYDPRNPALAVLEPGADLPAFAPMATGGLFFVIGLIAGMFALTGS